MSPSGAGTSAPPARHPAVAEVLAAARQLRAVTVEVGAGALPDLVRAGGASERYLWAKNDVTILGCGEALRLRLPAGWAAPAHTALVGEALAAIDAEDGLSGPVAGRWPSGRCLTTRASRAT